MQLTDEDWKYKILNASPTRLVIVTYELALDRIAQAEAAFSAGELPLMRENINRAKEVITELLASLDTTNDIGRQMADLYIMLNKLLTKAYFANIKKPLVDTQIILNKLMAALMKEVDDNFDAGADALGSGVYSGIKR